MNNVVLKSYAKINLFLKVGKKLRKTKLHNIQSLIFLISLKDEIVIKKILFAMSYFIDENDEIPDVIPDYGYLDDVKVVSWVIDDIRNQIPKMTRA